ncbi:MAG: lipopolysaccharide heptosyltransferase II [Candidatus Omnitrophica bacterium]|nr:lipopolysaccharide heptosyltransferase II [Candidatus Omnitrophota bacterium]
MKPFPRILVIRLDRLGDVVLSTPVLRALREAYPRAFLAMMVRPVCRELVEGHPCLDEVIVYDKDGRHRSVWQTARVALGLRRERFDTAIVLHPSNRSHWIPWLAGIPIRIGYDRKTPWLLTHRVSHRKQEGRHHEAAYTLQMLRVLGLEPPATHPVIPVRAELAARVRERLRALGVSDGQSLVAVHPSASCVSKRWMPERFADVADRLTLQHGVTVVVVAGPDDAAHAQAMTQAMRQPAINLAGQLSVGELAALLARCRLLLSNDSGPVHIAAAVGTPVVDIFGRNQRGLSPARWGPLGDTHVVLHKEVGCVVCLAHQCTIQFKCLTELSVEEVYHAALSVLRRQPAK